MAPAAAAPKHQVPRLMPITRPRRRAGQVSATSIEPSAHSPFSAKFTTQRAATKAPKVGADRHDRHHQREQRDVERQQRAAAVAVGEPRPGVHAGDADQQRDLQPGAVLRNGDADSPG